MILCGFLITLICSGTVAGVVSALRACARYLTAEQGLWKASGDTEGQKDNLSTGLLGRILSKQSCFMPEPQESSRADVLGPMWLTKFSFLLPKIKWHGQEHMVESATLSIPLELTPLLYSPQLRVFSPSPLCLPARFYDPSSTCALSQCSCWLLFTDVALNSANTTSLVPSIPVLTRHFFPCLLTKDFSCRAVCQVTHLFS